MKGGEVPNASENLTAWNSHWKTAGSLFLSMSSLPLPISWLPSSSPPLCHDSHHHHLYHDGHVKRIREIVWTNQWCCRWVARPEWWRWLWCCWWVLSHLTITTDSILKMVAMVPQLWNLLNRRVITSEIWCPDYEGEQWREEWWIPLWRPGASISRTFESPYSKTWIFKDLNMRRIKERTIMQTRCAIAVKVLLSKICLFNIIT